MLQEYLSKTKMEFYIECFHQTFSVEIPELHDFQFNKSVDHTEMSTY